MEKQKKSPAEAGPGRRLMYVKMRLAELREEMKKLRAEREVLVAKRGPGKTPKTAAGKDA